MNSPIRMFPAWRHCWSEQNPIASRADSRWCGRPTGPRQSAKNKASQTPYRCMLRGFLEVVSLTILAQAAYGAVPQKPFIECSREELVRAVPELSGIQFDSNQ